MEPMTMMALASLAAPVVGGVLGQGAASGARGASEDAYKRALAQFSNISVPDLSELDLANLQNTGMLNNLSEQDILLGNSAAEGIILNPADRARQELAMQQMQDKSVNGMSPADLAQFELNRRNAAGEAEAKSAQIMQNMQSRGMGGSGAELIARLQAAQSGADRQAQLGLQQSVAAQQAREAATRDMFSGASSMRNQDSSEQQYLANARDNINRINNANRIGTQQRNVAGQNQANQWNVQNNQRIADANVGFNNQERTYNTTQLPQQNFNNQMNLASARAGANTAYGNQQANQAANTAGMYATIGQGVGGAFSAYNQQENNNKMFDLLNKK
jgi:hypothetical protein